MVLNFAATSFTEVYGAFLFSAIAIGSEVELTTSVISSEAGHWLLEVSPVTGRPHQIRVQLASMGCPIKGDLKYGDGEANEDGSICLHAKQLSFEHPIRKVPLIIKAPLPDMGLWKYFLKLDLE